jgi:membrane associated rhomboid family serine protease
MRLHYNSPVVLTFGFICTAVLLLNQVIPNFSLHFFSVGPDMSLTSPLSYFRMFSHTIGHANWQHLIGNFSLILLIGPILEEKYGSRDLLVMMGFTAFLTGVLQLTMFHEYLMGASGIAFMMILLSSFTNFQQGKIPLTFILVTIIFVGNEVASSLKSDSVSQFAHILGGMCGAAFGFFIERGERSQRSRFF